MIQVRSEIALRHVHKTYAADMVRVHALRGVNMEIGSGEFLAIAGPSGSGKSTLLNLIGGLDRPTSGSILFNGVDITKFSQTGLSRLRLTQIGFIFQSYNLIPMLTVRENVEYVLTLQGDSEKVRKGKALDILNEVGLHRYEGRRPSELSGGQQQRVAVARAIVSNPSLVLADEPTANLDSHTANSLMDLMAVMNEKKKVTFVFSSHDPMVLSRAKRVIQLHDGEIQA